MTGFDNNCHGRDNLAQNMARDLDCGNGQGVARILQDVYRHDRRDFSNLVRDINNREQNGRGDDLIITQNGQVYVTDCNRQIRVGQIDQRGGGRRDDDCDPRDRGRGHDWDRGGNRGRDRDCDPRDRGNGRDWDRGGNRGRDRDCDPRDRGRDWPGHGRGRGGHGGVDIDIDIDIDLGRGRGRYPGGSIPIPDCYPGERPPVHRPPYDRDCEPPIVFEPPYERPCPPPPVYRRPPYVDRDCNPPVIRRRDRDCEPDYRGSRRGEYDQDGEIAGTVIGSVIGGVIGHNSRGRRDNTLLGVFAGGALGNVIGREVDRNRNQREYGWR